MHAQLMRWRNGFLGAIGAGFAISAAAVQDGIPQLDHVFVIMLENHSYAQIIGNPATPFITGLAATQNIATSYKSTANPSLPNYLATIAGSDFGVANDGSPAWGAAADNLNGPYRFDAPTIASQLVATGRTWKTYQEDLPAAGSTVNFAPGAGVGALYAVKHNPFPYFAAVQNDAGQLANMVPLAQLGADLAGGGVPNLAYIVPNQCNDMHGLGGAASPCGAFSNAQLLAQGDSTVRTLVTGITASTTWQSGRNALFIVFDESEGPPGQDPLVAIAMTNYGVTGVHDATPYNHYSLLKTMEAGFGLPYLANAANAQTMAPLLAPVPEPASAAMLLAGMGLLGCAVRRTRLRAASLTRSGSAHGFAPAPYSSAGSA